MTPEQIEIASSKWMAGRFKADIAREVGVSVYRLEEFSAKNRDRFPKRVFTNGAYVFLNRPRTPECKTQKPGIMRFTNSSGYVCSMPYVSILSKEA